MIADYYPPTKGYCSGFIRSAFPGVMFGLFAGGWINEFFGWRGFFVVGRPVFYWLSWCDLHYANRRAAWQRAVPTALINPASARRPISLGKEILPTHVLCRSANSLCRLWLYPLGPQF